MSHPGHRGHRESHRPLTVSDVARAAAFRADLQANSYGEERADRQGEAKNRGEKRADENSCGFGGAGDWQMHNVLIGQTSSQDFELFGWFCDTVERYIGYALWCEEGKREEGEQERSTCQLMTFAPGRSCDA